MFAGTIEVEVRSIVQEHVRTWDVSDVWVGCSGNFSIERFLGPLHYTMHGNDVSIYTCQLGKYLSGQRVDFTLRDESKEQLGWLEPFMETDADKIAAFDAERYVAADTQDRDDGVHPEPGVDEISWYFESVEAVGVD